MKNREEALNSFCDNGLGKYEKQHVIVIYLSLQAEKVKQVFLGQYRKR